MLVTPALGRTIFSLGHLETLEPTLVIASILQMLIAGLYIAAGARRFSSDRLLGFDSTLSILLLLLWTGASIAGMIYVEDALHVRNVIYGQNQSIYVFVVGIVTVLSLGILPVSSAVRSRRTPPMLITMLSAAIVSLVLSTSPQVNVNRVDRTAATVIAIVSFLMAMRYVIDLAISRGWWTRPIIAMWIFVFWIMPSIVDAIFTSPSTYPPYPTPQPDTVMWNQIISLPGMLYHCWSDYDLFQTDRVWAAVITQVFLTGLAASCFYSLRRNGRSVLPAISLPAPSTQASDLAPDGLA